MKRISTTVFSLLLGSMFLYSCETCDNPTVTEVTQADINWLVYDGEKYPNPLFENESNELIESYKYSGYNAQTVPGEGVSLQDDCIEKLDTQIVVEVADTTERYPSLYTYILKRPDSLQVRVAVERRGDWPIDTSNPDYDVLDVNGFTYFDVFEVTPDSLKANSVKKILFNKDFGFLQVDFYDGKQLRLVR